MATHKSVETKYLERAAEQFFTACGILDRRSFLKVSAAALGATAGLGRAAVLHARERGAGRREIARRNRPSASPTSPTRTCTREERNDRFVRGLLRAVDDVNHLDPQPDFVFYGGDLAQLGADQAARIRGARSSKTSRPR